MFRPVPTLGLGRVWHVLDRRLNGFMLVAPFPCGFVQADVLCETPPRAAGLSPRALWPSWSGASAVTASLRSVETELLGRRSRLSPWTTNSLSRCLSGRAGASFDWTAASSKSTQSRSPSGKPRAKATPGSKSRQCGDRCHRHHGDEELAHCWGPWLTTVLTTVWPDADGRAGRNASVWTAPVPS
jgi:hypothetical protein